MSAVEPVQIRLLRNQLLQARQRAITHYSCWFNNCSVNSVVVRPCKGLLMNELTMKSRMTKQFQNKHVMHLTMSQLSVVSAQPRGVHFSYQWTLKFTTDFNWDTQKRTWIKGNNVWRGRESSKCKEGGCPWETVEGRHQEVTSTPQQKTHFIGWYNDGSPEQHT